MAVVSYRRMDPVYFGQPVDEGLLLSRLRKMVGKQIGLLYFGLPASDNPRSMMYRGVMGIQELDAMSEEY